MRWIELVGKRVDDRKLEMSIAAKVGAKSRDWATFERVCWMSLLAL